MLQQVENEIKHLSPTKIEAALKCGYQVQFRYEDRAPEPSGGFLLAGRVVHKVLERALKRVVLGGKLPEAKEMDDWFLPEWEAHVKKEEERPTFIGWQWDADDPEENVKRDCRALIPFVRTDVLPALKPKLIEHTVKLEYQSEMGSFLVWGVLDLLEEDGLLSDWKTTRNVSQNQKKSWLQLAHYARFVFETMGQQNVKARKLCLVFGEKPSLEIIEYVMTPAHREWFARCAAAAWKIVKTRAYAPPPEGSWWCSPDWCSFWGLCKGRFFSIKGNKK